MNNTLKSTVKMVRNIYWNSKMKPRRHFIDFFSDRITSSCTNPNLFSAINKLASSVDCQIGLINPNDILDFLKVCSSPDAIDVYEWIREYQRIVAMLCILKKEEVDDALEYITIDTKCNKGIAITPGIPNIVLEITCSSPLLHGSDIKAGNCTLFRRMNVLSNTSDTLVLPFYSGNALRGQLRDLLADDFLLRLGLIPRKDIPPVALWFFHAIYAGGALEEGSAADKGINNILGKNGSSRAEGFYRVRNMLPTLSLLGTALGNRILNGRLQVMDLRPRCIEWGTGKLPVSELFEWQFLTRREDHEGYDYGNNSSMIANMEVLKAGSVMDGGIDTDINITDIELSALGHGIQLLIRNAKLGAEVRRGFGNVEIISIDQPSPDLYLKFMTDRKNDILNFLVEIGAVDKDVADEAKKQG